ncbi:hypothetical protein ZTR_07835 [Talaromyces verruculosus]|nr:hypothetical protein ZTR_07835 [Talaromyces verruculosus]
MILEGDQCLQLRDGTKIYADIYRPAEGEPVPAIVVWGPYGKSGSGRNRIEDIKAMQKKYPLSDSYCEDKRANMKQIQVPAYILASYSTGIHTLGSFRGYEEIPHNEKWLTIHGTQEWYDLYTPERIEELHAFFDRYTKGIENRWEATPRIRGALLNFNGPAQTGIEFSEPFWIYEKNPRKRLYVNWNNTLSKQSPPTKGSLTYDADTAPVAQLDADPEELKFSFKLDRRTSLIGPLRAVLYLSTSTKGDFDVYVQLKKADSSGRLLQNLNIPSEDLNVSSVDDVPLISRTKYVGPSGILRASNREIDEEKSKPHWKTLSHKQVLPVLSEDLVRVEIEI